MERTADRERRQLREVIQQRAHDISAEVIASALCVSVETVLAEARGLGVTLIRTHEEMIAKRKKGDT